MAVTMILELPSVPEPQCAITPRLLIADLPLANLVYIAPQIEPAASHGGDIDDGEPTWEDAAWQ